METTTHQVKKKNKPLPHSRKVENAKFSSNVLSKKKLGEEYLISLIRRGLSKKVMDEVIKLTGITQQEMAGYIRTSDRTLRRYTPSTILSAEQSERIIELALLYYKGGDVFENMDAFKQWMDTPLLALGNKKPKGYLDTSIGIEKLHHILGRIEHGIYS